VPGSIFLAPVEVQAAFLAALFGAEGCVARIEHGKATRYVGLGSSSDGLLRDVQKLLLGLGIRSHIYANGKADRGSFTYRRHDGSLRTYASHEAYDLRISGSHVDRFARLVGFSTAAKTTKLTELLATTKRYRTKPETHLVAR